MKAIKLALLGLLVSFGIVSCTEKETVGQDIDYTPVYHLTEITPMDGAADLGLDRITIYQEEDLLMTVKINAFKSYEHTGYTDATSDETGYDISLVWVMPTEVTTETEDGESVTEMVDKYRQLKITSDLENSKTILSCEEVDADGVNESGVVAQYSVTVKNTHELH